MKFPNFRHTASRVSYTAEKFAESNKPLKNPYCGFYHIIRYTLSDDEVPKDLASNITSYTEALALLEINLKNYRKSEISESGLSHLNGILSAWEKSPFGTKLILRFLYDWDGIALATEPDSIETVLRHMEQVSEAVNRYRDTVYIMQGAFIGNWGEMHHSKFSDLKSIKVLVNRLNELIIPSVYLAVRTPSLWRGINCLYEPPEAPAKPSLVGRTGLFNDGILGSQSDLGTYGSTLKRDADSPAYQGTRNEELVFQNKLCRYVPNGGEVVFNNNLAELENAVFALGTMHVSYLNADYDSRVFEKWKNSVWTGSGAFAGCDGYTYIKAHLGYRYLIDSCKIKKSGIFSPSCALCLTVKNTGFSNAYKPFETSLTLVSAKTGEKICVPIDLKLETLGSREKNSCKVNLPIGEIKDGEYRIYLAVKDMTDGQTVLLGNEMEIAENGYLIGRLTK